MVERKIFHAPQSRKLTRRQERKNKNLYKRLGGESTIPARFDYCKRVEKYISEAACL
jgi:hypothetical protein